MNSLIFLLQIFLAFHLFTLPSPKPFPSPTLSPSPSPTASPTKPPSSTPNPSKTPTTSSTPTPTSTTSPSPSTPPSSPAPSTASQHTTQDCRPLSPYIVIDPATQFAYAGTTLQYTLTVKNQDYTAYNACPPTTISLSLTKPDGWSANLSSTSVTLKTRESTTLQISATSPSSAAPGGYLVGVVASRPELSQSLSTNTNYQVVAPTNPSPQSSP